MKDKILNDLDKYNKIYPDELKRQSILMNFLASSSDNEITDWNNFNGHIVASAFIMAKKEKKFALIYHEHLHMFVYPGGHIDASDSSPLEAAKREIREETGIDRVEVLKVTDDEEVPFDIDTHLIDYNEALNLPSHYHFDFRYFFLVDEVTDLVIDKNESSSYKWVTFDELAKNPHYEKCINKLKDMTDSLSS